MAVSLYRDAGGSDCLAFKVILSLLSLSGLELSCLRGGSGRDYPSWETY